MQWVFKGAQHLRATPRNRPRNTLLKICLPINRSYVPMTNSSPAKTSNIDGFWLISFYFIFEWYHGGGGQYNGWCNIHLVLLLCTNPHRPLRIELKTAQHPRNIRATRFRCFFDNLLRGSYLFGWGMMMGVGKGGRGRRWVSTHPLHLSAYRPTYLHIFPSIHRSILTYTYIYI